MYLGINEVVYQLINQSIFLEIIIIICLVISELDIQSVNQSINLFGVYHHNRHTYSEPRWTVQGECLMSRGSWTLGPCRWTILLSRLQWSMERSEFNRSGSCKIPLPKTLKNTSLHSGECELRLIHYSLSPFFSFCLYLFSILPLSLYISFSLSFSPLFFLSFFYSVPLFFCLSH